VVPGAAEQGAGAVRLARHDKPHVAAVQVANLDREFERPRVADERGLGVEGRVAFRVRNGSVVRSVPDDAAADDHGQVQERGRLGVAHRVEQQLDVIPDGRWQREFEPAHGGPRGARDANENIKAVSRFLGHSSPTITLNYYGHFMPASEDRTRTAVDRALSGWCAPTVPQPLDEEVLTSEFGQNSRNSSDSMPRNAS
jgi:hypothetical protein